MTTAQPISDNGTADPAVGIPLDRRVGQPSSEGMVTKVRERPILFSAPMVLAILNGTKRQTRRMLRDQNPVDLGSYMHGGHFSRRPVFDKIAQAVIGHRMAPVHCPYGEPGDRLWVRETWHTVDGEHAFYRADYMHDPNGDREHGIIWRPSIFMPRWASRITLDIKTVRVERLQDISANDAEEEGIGRYDNGTFGIAAPAACMGPNARRAYRRLWDYINGPGSWDSNPWVWALEFRRMPNVALRRAARR